MRVTLLGYGKETRSIVDYFSKLHPEAHYTVYDSALEPPAGLPVGADYRIDLKQNVLDIDADIIVRTPSFSPLRIKTSGKVTTATREFFAVCPVPIIGVTGTKGKGTTSSLIAHILREAGYEIWLVGNIGHPALNELEAIQQAHQNGRKALVVYELSSFQLWDLDRSPAVAVVLMIEEEHLDAHAGIDDYIAAKAHITEYQHKNDLVVYFSDNPVSTAIAHSSKAQALPFKVDEGEYLCARGVQIVKKSELLLRGEHNYQNVAAAVTVALKYVEDIEQVAQAVKSFTGLEHRLEVCQVSKNGVTYVNDSYSSAPPATIAAIRAFTEPEILIVGGKDRGLAFEPLAACLNSRSNIKRVIVIGAAQARIIESFDQAGFKNYEINTSQSLEQVVDRACAIAESGDVVILSPGCASFDMFHDFTDRGNQFKAIVSKL